MSDTTEILLKDEFHITHTVTEGMSGQRLDAFMKGRYQRRSRETLKQAIRDGKVTVSRPGAPELRVGRIKPSLKLGAGDVVHVKVGRKPEPAVSFDYKILYEDEAILVIDKPGNLPVHPAGSYFFHTLLIHLRTDGFQRSAVDSEREYFLAHRIDKETSGLLVMAKTKEDCAHLTKQFKSRVPKKKYLAVVHGQAPQEFKVEHPLIRSVTSRVKLKMETCDLHREGALPALTEFRTLQTNNKFSLVECFPKTGRQHQIRVHLADAGFPIVGDKLYSVSDEEAARFYNSTRKVIDDTTLAARFVGPELEAKLVIDRQALHAAAIDFVHPRTEKRVFFSSVVPDDFKRLLE